MKTVKLKMEIHEKDSVKNIICRIVITFVVKNHRKVLYCFILKKIEIQLCVLCSEWIQALANLYVNSFS